MTKRKPKPAPVVFDQAMLDRAYRAAVAQAQKKSFTADPCGVLVAAIEAALQVPFRSEPPE